ncbi:LPXTG cell wall anchor domain-containing protein, partial [Listeria monocytogenes]|nr:LPXTG cell wall anchor domain-containing protein [Listeria monocytogenes]
GATEELTAQNFQQVKNKKITIPQTGGIGTVVFTVVGLSTMVFAFIAMKKRQAEEA